MFGCDASLDAFGEAFIAFEDCNGEKHCIPLSVWLSVWHGEIEQIIIKKEYHE